MTYKRDMGKKERSFRERLSSWRGRIQKRRKRWRKQRPWNGQKRRALSGRTDLGWGICAVVWQEEAGDGTTPQTIKKDRQEHGPDGKENGGWGTTSYHPHQSGGREGGTWYKGFENKATPSSRKPNTTNGPGRDTISVQTKTCSTPSTEQSCGSESGANTTRNTSYLPTHRQR